MKYFLRYLMAVMMLVLVTSCFFNKSAQEEQQVLTAEQMLQAGDAQYAAGQYKEALATYQDILIKHPTTDLHIDVQLRIADTYGHLEEYEAQMKTLLQLLQENIIPQRVPDIYIQIAKFYERAALFNPGTVSSDTSDYKSAIAYYQKAVNYKDSKDNLAKAQAMYRRALVEAKIGRIDQARAHYTFVTQNFPDTPYAVLAQYKLQNPKDASELSTDETSLENYKQALGVGEAPAETPAVEQEQKAPAEEQQAPKAASQEEDAQNTLFQQTPADSSNQK